MSDLILIGMSVSHEKIYIGDFVVIEMNTATGVLLISKASHDFLDKFEERMIKDKEKLKNIK